MTNTDIERLLQKQRSYYLGGNTLPVSFRREQLKKLYRSIQAHQEEIEDALRADLGKSAFEGFMCEVGMVLTEITYILHHLNRWCRAKRVHTPMSQFPSKSYRLPSPYGNVLIMSPWNYPFLLTVEPLCDAIAAGNTAIVKPSAYSPATSTVIEKLISECFPTEYVACVTGGRQENAALLEQKFDMIFFTGSQNVGKEVLRHAAEHLTPTVLELGGKSPCIVDKTADIPLSARRIVFGKFLNCGQTCVAPDYILCEASVKDALLEEIKKETVRQFGVHPLENENYGRIVNQKHFERILGLIDPKKAVHGGEFDKEALRIAPTVMDHVTERDAVMGEEIFGPILPVLAFDDFDAMLRSLKQKAKPLALYLFSQSKEHRERITHELSFGGGCINDVIIHLATSEMGFGGVGESGMGEYHGKAGFDAFSHTKSIVHKKTWLDLPMRYQPYTKKNEILLRKILR